MTIYNTIPAKAAGAWRSCTPSVRVAGAWVAVREAYVKVAGAWVQFFANLVFALAGIAYYGTRVGASCTVQYLLTSAGVELYIDENSVSHTIGNWVTPTSAAAGYECRMTVTSGTFSVGTVGSWLALTSTRTWAKTQSIVGVGQVVGTIEIRDAATLAVVATATVDLTAERA